MISLPKQTDIRDQKSLASTEKGRKLHENQFEHLRNLISS